ncbi:MAG: hypothetical protein E7345_00570 [Clostridiales bacterium]|nr:hypothetical protein [Clostridiales bacterium]
MLLNKDVIEENLKCLFFNGNVARGYVRIFEVANENNKQILDELLSKLFDGAVIEYEKKKFLELNDNNENLLNRELNRSIATVFNNIKFINNHANKLGRYLTSFASGNYFHFGDDGIGFREMSTELGSVHKTLKNLTNTSTNYDALMTRDGTIYLAVTEHEDIIPYLIANSIDLKGAVRISYNPKPDKYRKEPLIFGTLFPYMGMITYASPDDMRSDSSIVLSSSRISKLCDYMVEVIPNVTETKMKRIFQFSENFGYDFNSKSNQCDASRNYMIGMTNLNKIMDEVAERFPDSTSGYDLVAMYKDRMRHFSSNILD